MDEIVIQEGVNFLALVLQWALGVGVIWLVGRLSGLWALIENEMLRRFARTGAAYIVMADQNQDGMPDSQEYINGLVAKATEWVEAKLSARGFNIELDVIEAAVREAVDDLYEFVEIEIEEVENVNEEVVE
jgi:hypothetical protein